MKKITLIAALLGTAYFANAQVGIGTPTPHASSILEIDSDDKGVLIPRVSLADSETVLVSGIAQENSLLVYNTEAKNVTGKEVKIGFYYWTNTGATPSEIGKWTKIVNQTDLDTAISNLTNHQLDIDKIKALLDAAYGANNLGANPTTGTHGGMVYTPAVPAGNEGVPAAIPAKIEYLVYNNSSSSVGTQGQPGYIPAGPGYVKVDATYGIIDLIKGNETKTKLVNIGGNTYYISESFVGTEPTTAAAFATAASNNTSGIYKVDFVNGVTKNFNEIKNTVTNINKPNSTTEFYTVEEYIQMLANTNVAGDTKIVLTGTGTEADPYVAKLQKWDASATPPAWVDVDNSAFSTIVKANETRTTIAQSIDNSSYVAITQDSKAIDKIVYEYNAEYGVKNYLSVTDDIKWSIENNQELQDVIKNILNTEGSVYYNLTTIAAATDNGVFGDAELSANTFYYIDANDKKVKIVLPIDIAQFITALTNATTDQKQLIKNQLGDNFNTSTVVNTGDTWINNQNIYKAIVNSQVLAGTANITGASTTNPGSITIDGASNMTIIDIKVVATNGITSSVTDLSVSGNTISFRIGTGNMYKVLSASNLDIKVIVEFAGVYTQP